MPALFISGTLDGRTSIADAERVRTGFPDSGHIVVDGASHTPYGISVALLDRMVAFANGQKPLSSRFMVPIELRGPDEPPMIAELTELAIEGKSGTAASRMRQLKMDPKHHFTSHVVMGVISNLQKAKYMKGSTSLLSVGVEIFPDNALLLIRMAEVELSRGNSEVAVRLFARAAAADPLNPTARAQLARLGVAQK